MAAAEGRVAASIGALADALRSRSERKDEAQAGVSKEYRWRNFHIDEIRKGDHKIDTMPSARHSAESRCYFSKMDKELEQRLVERWPHQFNTEGCVRRPAMSSGLRNGDGWFDILSRLYEDLESLVKEFERAIDCKFEILQVKEKFGGPRIHYPCEHANDAIRQRIDAAEQESFHTNEICGQPGTLRKGDSLRYRWFLKCAATGRMSGCGVLIYCCCRLRSDVAALRIEAADRQYVHF